MKLRKELKIKARKNFKRHYLLFILVCLIGAFIGAEYKNSLFITKSVNNNVINDVLSDGKLSAKSSFQKIKEDSIIVKDKLIKNDNEDFFSNSSGVLAMIVNSIKSNSITVTILSSIRSLVGSIYAAISIFIIISALLSIFVTVFIINVYKAVARRIFLEGRVYDKVTKQRFFFLLRVKKWFMVAIIFFITSLFKFLWSLTIVGGIIKYYSYYMVPYILAENPDISSKDAINLSKAMMNGHKWELFVINLSFIGWDILSVLTLGLLDVFFTNAYKSSVYSEYYAYLRRIYINNNELLNEFFVDKYLFVKASKNLLKDTYNDINKLGFRLKKNKVKLYGVKGFLIRNFGIDLLNNEDSNKYNENLVIEVKINEYKDELNGISYPTRLNIIPEIVKLKRIENVNYLKSYKITSLVLLFFIMCFIGWIWEVSLHLVQDGVFVNRGTIHGPWLPIYGWGGVLILVLLYKFRKKPELEFLLTIILCGIVEYFTSYYLEVVHHMKWWDYSGYFLNLNGRICAEGLLIFGLGGLLVVYFLAPILDGMISKMKRVFAIMLSIVLIVVFCIDNIYSSKYPNVGKGITDYGEFQIK